MAQRLRMIARSPAATAAFLGLPLLRERRGPLASCAALAVARLLWHLPLFRLQGSYQVV
jgi:hypothetical protein